MTRKAGTTSAETKQRLIDAAVGEFSKGGFAHTSLRRICARANVTTGALYFFFDNKDDLFEKCIEPLTSDVVKVLDDRLKAEPHFFFEPAENGQRRRLVAEDIAAAYSRHPLEAMAIANNRSHPAVASFDQLVHDRLVTYERQVINQYYKGANTNVFNDDTIEWLAEMQLAAVNTVSQSSTTIESRKQMYVLTCFLEGGLRALTALDPSDLEDEG